MGMPYAMVEAGTESGGGGTAHGRKADRRNGRFGDDDGMQPCWLRRAATPFWPSWWPSRIAGLSRWPVQTRKTHAGTAAKNTGELDAPVSGINLSSAQTLKRSPHPTYIFRREGFQRSRKRDENVNRRWMLDSALTGVRGKKQARFLIMGNSGLC